MGTDFETTELSGQVALPGFQDILECETMALKRPEDERFCEKYVEFGGDTAKAWQAAFDGSVSRLQAQKNAHKLLKKGEIRRRIAEVSAVMRNRAIHDVIAFQRRAMNFDPAEYINPKTGGQVPVHELPEHVRRGIGWESRVVNGCLMYAPVFPSPQKAAESLAKMFGIEKQMVELSGPGGGPVAHRHHLADDVLEKIAAGGM